MRKFLFVGSLLLTITLLAGCNQFVDDIIKTLSNESQVVEEDDTSDVVVDEDIEKSDQHIDEEAETDADEKIATEADENDALFDEENGSSPSSSTSSDRPGSSTSNNESSEQAHLKEMQERLEEIGEELHGGMEASGSSSPPAKSSSSSQCPKDYNQDYSSIRAKLNHDFYFPACTHVVSVNDRGSSLVFTLNHKILEDRYNPEEDLYTQVILHLHESYHELAGGNLIFSFPNFADLNGWSEFYLHGNENGHTLVEYQLIITRDTKDVEINVTYEYP